MTTPTAIHLRPALDDPRYGDVILVGEHSERFALVARQTAREAGTCVRVLPSMVGRRYVPVLFTLPYLRAGCNCRYCGRLGALRRLRRIRRMSRVDPNRRDSVAARDLSSVAPN